jgi:autotransporter-associated beta strand protein
MKTSTLSLTLALLCAGFLASLSTAAVAANLNWNGTVNGTWNIGATGTGNWLDPATGFARTFFNGDTVTFSDAATGPTAITCTGAPAPSSITFNNNTKSYTITGVIAGSGGITKSGAGVATLLGANTFTGGVSVLAGTFTLGASNVVSDFCPLVLNAGKLATNGFSDTMGVFALVANSFIDMGAGNSILTFDDISDWSPTATLTVQNWTGTAGAAGGTDRIIFSKGSTTLTAGKLANVQFYDSTGSAIGTGAAVINNELVPAAAPASTVIITSAVLDADNSNVFDHQGDTPEYIVIKNTGTTTASLAGWTLSNDPQQPSLWAFPTNANLAAGETKLIFASAKNRTNAEPYATNFRLPCPPAPIACLYQQTALRSQLTVQGTGCRPCTNVIQKGTPLSWIIPNTSFSSLGTTWTTPTYNAGQWTTGANCIGYDGDPICDNLILYSTYNTTDVDTTNRIIFDMSGPTLHPGNYTTGAFSIAASGRVAQGGQFSGAATSFVTYANHAELNPTDQDYTFAIWVSPNQLNGSPQVVYQKVDTQALTGYYLTIDGDGGATFGARAGSNQSYIVRTTSQITAGAWTQLTAVLDRVNNELRLYRNGVLVDTTIIPGPAAFKIENTKPLVSALAFNPATQINFAGRMDEFAIWGRALIPAEITTVVNQGVAGVSFKVPVAGQSSSPPYNTLITTDVKAAMKGINTSAYERIPFTIPNATTVSKLQLSINYDDGFIAYINGTKVAERNAPAPPAYNSAATIDRPDTNALTAEVIDLTAFKGSLVTGAGNVLAIHGLNASISDNRFLICPELCIEEDAANGCFCSTNGRNFWIAFPGNEPDETTNPLVLSVCITGTAGTSGLVTAPSIGLSTAFTIPGSGSITIPIDKKLSLEASDTIESKAVRVVANQDVAVYARSREDYTTDTYLAIPATCLGSEYLVLGYKNLWPGSPDLNGSEFGIVAPSDNTRVTIKPSKLTNGHPAGVAYSFTLMQGQTYFLRNTTADTTPDLDDLSGTEILSDKPIAVMAGHRCANINGQTFFCNHIVEQLLPVPLWSTEYVSSPLKTRTNDTFRVIASRNTTLVFFDGVAKALLNRGEIFETVESVARVITANAPVLVAQYSNSSDYDGVANSDPAQINLQPTRSWLGSYKVCVPPSTEFSKSYVNVVAGSTADLAGIIISPAVISTEGPIAMFGGKAYARYEVTPNTTYSFSGKSFGLIQYGFDSYDAYGNSGGMGFNDFFPPTFGTCPSDMTIYCTGTVPPCTAPMPDLISQLNITDNCCSYASLTLRQSIAVGTLLPEGDYVVTITATDCVQNTSTCVINLHVRPNWQASNFPASYPNPSLELTTWGWTADKDRDGIPNNLEYALGTDPNVINNLSNIVKVNLVPDGEDNFLEITYRRRLDDPSLEYVCQGSADLTNWTQSLGHFEVRSSQPDTLSGYQRITERCLDSPTLSNGKYYLRLKVNQR